MSKSRINENEFKKIFTSKADVLKFLKPQLKKSKIENMFDFTVHNWNSNKATLLRTIKTEFSPKIIIIRSSALDEDSFESSKAGFYTSILDIDSTNIDEIRNAIESVIASYSKDDQKNDFNRILIQEQTKDIVTSGVIFTITGDIGSPYYTINFEDGSSTEGVTQGKIGNTIKIFRKIKLSKLEKKWQILLNSITEIESILNSNSLDIEFGITKNSDMIIFQVRPLIHTKNNQESDESKIEQIINSSKFHFSELTKSEKKIGKTTYFSDMSDWNPAEIIGNNPNLLDYSMYDKLIMQSIWHEGRAHIGYQNISPSPLMIKFGNKPYVDIRASFNSLIPENIPLNIRQKLIDFYLRKFINNPQLHDKVEFEILFTCYDLDLPHRLIELEKNNFSKEEITIIQATLLEFTNNIISKFPELSHECELNIKNMIDRRSKLLSKIDPNNKKLLQLLETAEKLLNDCMEFGTRPFSTMARIAFIASTILKSLSHQEGITKNFYDDFMNTIQTPLSELRDDVVDYSNNKLSKKKFYEKYGHLRPGTYDITANRYDKDESFFDQMKFLNQKQIPTKITDKKIYDKILYRHELKFEKIEFEDFIRKSITLREELKFHFTKNLSDALELIAEAGHMIGFSRSDLANLDINTILNSYKNVSIKQLQTILSNKIKEELKHKKILEKLALPSIITSEDDFEIIQYFSHEPNFITSKSISGETVNLNHSDDKNLENKIMLIENADPGYDWIFTKNPAGLITKYGGVASHMSIRCAEIGLPAAIGCGELLYEKLLLSKRILLDCNNKQVIVLEHELFDEELEVKKTLKSLGYIK